MKMGTKGKYAVIALIDLASCNPERRVTLTDLSTRQQISVTYLEQLFSKLRRAGIVRASRGPTGGYSLARPASDIRICDILEAVGEDINALHRGGGAKGALSGSHAQSMANRLWEGLSSHVYVFLHGTTLQDVVCNALEPCPALPVLLSPLD